MTRLRPTRAEVIEMCVLTVLAAGILFGTRSGVIDRELLLPTMTIYFVYLIVIGVRDLRRWLQRRAAANRVL